MNNNIEIVKLIMQQKIANFIKKNRNINKKELIEDVEKLLDKKENMYNMDEEELKKELKSIGNENE